MQLRKVDHMNLWDSYSVLFKLTSYSLKYYYYYYSFHDSAIDIDFIRLVKVKYYFHYYCYSFHDFVVDIVFIRFIEVKYYFHYYYYSFDSVIFTATIVDIAVVANITIIIAIIE